MKRLAKKQRGQGMTEYIIIVAVVAVLSIGIVVRFGDQIRNLFNVSADQMGGGTNSVSLDNKSESDSDRGLESLGE